MVESHEPKLPAEGINSSSQGHVLRNFALGILTIVGLVVILQVSVGVFSTLFVYMLSEEQELKIGDLVSDQLKPMILGEDSKRVDVKVPVQELTDQLWKPYSASRELARVQSSVQSSLIENAFALPGGRIVLTDQLVNAAESENELSFVICHELGHVYHRHPIKRLSSLFVALPLAVVMGSVDQLAVMGAIQDFSQLMNSRDDEYKADEFALNCLHKKYGHVAHYDLFFKRLMSKTSESMADKVFQYRSTHPLSKDRIEKLSLLAKEAEISLDGKVTSLP